MSDASKLPAQPVTDIDRALPNNGRPQLTAEEIASAAAYQVAHTAALALEAQKKKGRK